jgi:hypothetical protein
MKQIAEPVLGEQVAHLPDNAIQRRVLVHQLAVAISDGLVLGQRGHNPCALAAA